MASGRETQQIWINECTHFVDLFCHFTTEDAGNPGNPGNVSTKCTRVPQVHSRISSSLVSPRRGAGAGLGIAMLKGGRDSLNWKCKIFKVSNFRSFKFSTFQSFKVSKIPKGDFMVVDRYWSHIQDYQEFLQWIFRMFRPLPIPFSKIWNFCNLEISTIICFQKGFGNSVELLAVIWRLQNWKELVGEIMVTSARSENHENKGLSGSPKMSAKRY